MPAFKALLVDDEEAIRHMLAKVLETNGFTVATASSAAEGRAMLAHGDAFDVIVTDLRMESPLAGFEVVRAACEIVPRPLVVVLTAFPVPRSDWQSAGADALLVKGLDTLSIPKQLKRLLARRTRS
jgi:CheY-like chemotaxis protein